MGRPGEISVDRRDPYTTGDATEELGRGVEEDTVTAKDIWPVEVEGVEIGSEDVKLGEEPWSVVETGDEAELLCINAAEEVLKPPLSILYRRMGASKVLSGPGVLIT